MTIEEFLRVYPVRAPNLVWLLGAGASAAAGIPTAGALIWQFKRTLFCAAQRISVKSCEDLSDAAIQRRLDCYFESLGGFPPTGSPDEYSAYFEAAYPDAKDRRSILQGFLTGVKPSYGHLALAALMKMDKARIVWTPNFDKLVEDAAVQVLGSTSSFVVATLDNAYVAMQAINEGRWPVIAKMHGDFQSQRLKNTPQELRTQDAEMRRALLESSRRYGLIVVGYSGRDESILNTLHEAVETGHGFPEGLFWLRRSDFPTVPGVATLIEKAVGQGIQAELLEIQTFDELLGDILKQFGNVPADVETKLDHHAARLTEVPLDPPGRAWPVIRLNALPVMTWPTMCRRLVCQIGGTKDVRDAITKQQAKVVGARSQKGVLAFGSDAEVRRAFGAFHITEFDGHSIEPKRLRFESAELGLLRDSFALALESIGPFRVQRGRNSDVLHVDFSKASDTRVAALRDCAGSLTGTIPKAGIPWSEVLRFRLDFQLRRLWLLVEPTIYFGDVTSTEQRYIAADFVRERLATRYNRQWNALIEAWITLIMEDRKEIRISAFGISDGIDASFTVGRITGFSRRSTNI
jgi:NAD-dependent SIR2 family protein deacetylase